MTRTSDLNWGPNYNGLEFTAGTKLSIKTTAILDIESGGQLQIAGTQVTSNAAELNSLDGIATTWMTDQPGSHSITPGAEAGNVINVAVSLNDISGTAVAESKLMLVYLSDNSTGDGLTATAPSGGWAIGTDGTILQSLTANKCAWVWTETDGDFDLDITETGSATWYFFVSDGYNLQGATVTFT